MSKNNYALLGSDKYRVFWRKKIKLSTEFSRLCSVVVKSYKYVLKTGPRFTFHDNETNIKHTVDETVQLNRFSLR